MSRNQRAQCLDSWPSALSCDLPYRRCPKRRVLCYRHCFSRCLQAAVSPQHPLANEKFGVIFTLHPLCPLHRGVRQELRASVHRVSGRALASENQHAWPSGQVVLLWKSQHEDCIVCLQTDALVQSRRSCECRCYGGDRSSLIRF